MTQITAAVLRELNSPLSIETLTITDPGHSDVVVRMTASDVCGRDRAVITGGPEARIDIVLGHEGTGVVEEVGRDVSRVRVGDTVIVKNRPGKGCGSCFYCTRGQTIYCENPPPLAPNGDRFRDADGRPVNAYLDLGTLAEFIVTPEEAVVPVAAGLPPSYLALLGCPVRAAFWAVMNTAQVEPGASVAVIGCGPVGLSVIQAARISGASQIVAVDPLAPRRELAIRLGATEAVDPLAAETVDSVRATTAGRGADYVFEAVRSPETYAQAIHATRRGGVAVLMGIPTAEMTVTLPSTVLSMTGRTILGSHAGRYNLEEELRRYVRLAEGGQLDLGALVTRTVGIEASNEVFDDLVDPHVIRSVVTFA